MPVAYLPEIRLHLAQDAFTLWERTESQRGDNQVGPPPFWAFAWPGGQALARHLLDNRELVAGQRVLDLGAGSGLVAVAAAVAGAAHVSASEIDPYAIAAIELNAEANGVRVQSLPSDVLDDEAPDADVVLAGDVFYSAEMASRVLAYLDRALARGARVLVGDPGRAYLPRPRLTRLSSHDVPVSLDLEDTEVKHTTVWRLGRVHEGARQPACDGERQ